MRDYLVTAVGSRWDQNRVGTKLEAFAVAGGDLLSKYLHYLHDLVLSIIPRNLAYFKEPGCISAG